MASDLNLICNKPECTFSQTGQCVLNNDPRECQDRLESLNILESISIPVLGDPVLTPPKSTEVFRGSYTLGQSQAQQLMQERYCRIVGILGAPSAGKTACLVSLYLLLAHGRLSGFEFRDSKTIRSFEEISQGARQWNAADFPDQLTVHTEIADERRAGFLHLRLKSVNGHEFDMLLPDLPGEWSTALIDSNRRDRLSFLKSADCIWFMVNGEELVDIDKRFYTEHRLKLLFERVSELLGGLKPAFTLVITHKDQIDLKEHHFEKLKETVEINGFSFRVITIASFSQSDEVQPGDGIAELIQDLITLRSKQNVHFWPTNKDKAVTRHMLKFSHNNDMS